MFKTDHVTYLNIHRRTQPFIVKDLIFNFKSNFSPKEVLRGGST